MISDHLSYLLQVTLHLHFASFYGTKYFKKSKGKIMFIEQITEFELRGRGPLGRASNPKTGDYDKTKTFNRLRASGPKATSAEA